MEYKSGSELLDITSKCLLILAFNMTKQRTKRKNELKRKKRRLYAQVQAELEKSENIHEDKEKQKIEQWLMQIEENNQRCHEKWMLANKVSDTKFQKKQQILQERAALIQAIRQQMQGDKQEQKSKFMKDPAELLIE